MAAHTPIVAHEEPSATCRSRLNMAALAQNALVLGLWVGLFRSTFPLLQAVAWREDFRTNQVILIGIALLLLLRLRQDGAFLQRGYVLDTPLRMRGPALAVLIAASVAFLLTERFLDINILAACLFGLGSYGLLGLWLPPAPWRAGLPAALLLIGVLPFGEHVQTFIGYPMRMLTAVWVQHGLNGLGFTSIGIDTILVFENSVAQVDVPCSGVKSLWTGGLFLLAATWIDRKPINLRWLLIALAFVVTLFITNLARVAILIVVGPVLGWARLAELIHVPLGIVMFVLACAAGGWLLRALLSSSSHKVDSSPIGQTQRWFALMLIAALTSMNLAYVARPRLEANLSASALPTHIVDWPIELTVTPTDLRPGELDWLAQDGAEAVQRARFVWRGLSGTLLLVQSTSWRAHHKPERCFENYGLQVQQTNPQLVEGRWPLRVLQLSNGKTGGDLAALYWFQSAQQSTDDYSVRLWSALSLRPPRWVLVTMLFDGSDLGQHGTSSLQLSADTTALVNQIHAAVQQRLLQSEVSALSPVISHDFFSLSSQLFNREAI